MTDLQIDWGGLSVRDQVPARLPDLYAGKPLIVLGRYDQSGTETITLKGNVLGQPVQMELELDLPSQQPSHDAIPSVWARQRIRQIWNHNVGNETPQSRSEITELGLRHQLVTQYTSFVAVEKELSEIPQGNLISETIPGMMPDGMTEKPNTGPRTTASTAAATTQPASNGQSKANQPAASNSTSHAVTSRATPPTASSTAPSSSTASSAASTGRPSNNAQSRSSGSPGGSAGGGPIGPFTALFSIAGAGAAAMLRKKKTEQNTEQTS